MAVAVMLILNFAVFRVILSPFTMYHLLQGRDAWNYRNDETSILYWSSVFIIGFFYLLNYYWFILLIKLASKAITKKKTQ